MEERAKARGIRYIALDIHQQYCVIAGVDREGKVLLQAVRVEHPDLEGCLYLKTTHKKRLGLSNLRTAFYFDFLF